MKQAFIIMQIGNSDLDSVCEKAIIPALKACNLDPKRVDKHTKGQLLKSEIVESEENITETFNYILSVLVRGGLLP